MVPETWEDIELSDVDIEKLRHRKFIGSGKQWDERGHFQLELLRALGMKPWHRALDVGCGPVRAGVWLTWYLRPGNYCGVDSNRDFLSAATYELRKKKLEKLSPRLVLRSDFRPADQVLPHERFDYVLCFSVLNHLDEKSWEAFFSSMVDTTVAGAKIVVSHCRKFKHERLRKVKNLIGLRSQISIAALKNIARETKVQQKWIHEMSPIYVFTRFEGKSRKRR